MITICPTCHDAVDRGPLRITDEDVYRWKGITRSNLKRGGHLFVEPNEPPRLLLGSFAVQGDDGVVVFDPGSSLYLSFSIRDKEILLLNLSISLADGTNVLKVVDGYVRQQANSVQLLMRPGAVEVPAGLGSHLVPDWISRQYEAERRETGDDFPLLSLRVVAPGTVKVRGIWVDGDTAIVISDQAFSTASRCSDQPFRIFGAGLGTVLKLSGPLGSRLFGLVQHERSA